MRASPSTTAARLPASSAAKAKSASTPTRATSSAASEVKYGDYGAAIAEDAPTGFLKVFASKAGRIYGVSIIGEGSGEMINEWALAVQKRVRLHDIMMLQHSFPTMGFLSKRAAETWMMNRMRSETLRKLCRFMFRR